MIWSRLVHTMRGALLIFGGVLVLAVWVWMVTHPTEIPYSAKCEKAGGYAVNVTLEGRGSYIHPMTGEKMEIAKSETDTYCVDHHGLLIDVK